MNYDEIDNLFYAYKKTVVGIDDLIRERVFMIHVNKLKLSFIASNEVSQ